MTNPFDLTGKTALITGASRGLGQQFARTLASAGADVAITSRTLDSLDETAKEIESLGRRVVRVALNVREEASIQSAVGEVIRQLGHIDILMNNAGCNIRKPAVDVTWEDWATIVDTNLRGIFFVAQAVARHMIPRRYGRIINISSVVGHSGNAGQTNYCAAKAGMTGFTKSLAQEVGSRGITVNCVAPGFIDTDMTKELPEEQRARLLQQIPLGRLGAADDIAAAVAFLASPSAGYVSGETLHVNGGMYMA